MNPFELTYLCAEPFLPPLMKLVRRRLLELSRAYSDTPKILDVGGRKSHYTIGVRGEVTITDLPRESDIQKQLNLGVNDQIIAKTMLRRTNVRQVLLDDMTHSSLPDNTFDFAVSVEVLEHVERDEDFVSEVQRVLKPGGVFLMTTPNGDFVTNHNPDHKRHYKRQELQELLSASFENVKIEYAILGGTYRRWGLKSWSLSRPQKTVLSMFGNVINSIQSRGESLGNQAIGTQHLVATARKSLAAAQPLASIQAERSRVRVG